MEFQVDIPEFDGEEFDSGMRNDVFVLEYQNVRFRQPITVYSEDDPEKTPFQYRDTTFDFMQIENDFDWPEGGRYQIKVTVRLQIDNEELVLILN